MTAAPQKVMLTIRLTRDQREALNRAARAMGLSVNQFCLRLLDVETLAREFGALEKAAAPGGQEQGAGDGSGAAP